MITHSTPTFRLTLPDTAQLDENTKIKFSMVQDCVRIDKSDVTVSGKTVEVTLTQEESAKFKKGKATVELNLFYPNGARLPTQKKQISIDDNLLAEVVRYGDL